MTKLMDTTSLAKTLDAVNEALLFKRPLSAAERKAAAEFVALRQGLPRSYRGLFAPTDEEFTNGIRLFTGEVLRSGAGTAHILSEEAVRALVLLGVGTPAVTAAMMRSREAFDTMLPPAPSGRYCCGTCSVSLWRNLSVMQGPEAEARLADGLQWLKSRRKDVGWQSLPFHYTVLALSGIELPGALDELRHIAPAMERNLKRRAADTSIGARRRVVMETALARC